MSSAIIVENLSKSYRRFPAARPRSFKEAFLQGLQGIKQLKAVERFWALEDVNFKVDSGQMLGVIGANGAGKSTLLRLIGGVGRPDKGKIVAHGRIGALLDLGAGFHPDLTGRENVFITGVINGLTRREVAGRFDSIVEFAELEAFIDNPLRTYSTGMQMRLAFSVAAHVEPEILLVDEVLAVGDIAFQRKCLERISRFKTEGCTIVLVSHDAGSIRQLCDQAIWLRRGKLVAGGPAEVVVGQYLAEMSAETRRRTPIVRPVELTPGGIELRLNENRFGSMEMEISRVNLFNAAGFTTSEIESGESLRVEIDYQASQLVDSPIFGLTITREDGLVCYDTSTESVGLRLESLQGRGKLICDLERLDLIGGQYFIDIGIYEREWTYAYDYHWRVYPIVVRATRGSKGILCPPSRWEVGSVEEARLPWNSR